MKIAGRILLLTAFLYSLFSCSKSKQGPNQPATIVQQWKETERYQSPGSLTDWKKVDNGAVLIIHADSTYTMQPSHFALGSKGRFSRLTDSTLTVKDSDGSGGSRFYFTLKTPGVFEIWYGCIEGCGSRFQQFVQ